MSMAKVNGHHEMLHVVFDSQYTDMGRRVLTIFT